MRKYYDTDTNEIVTDEQLEAFWWQSDRLDCPDYNEWLAKATGENGTLVIMEDDAMTIYGRKITDKDMHVIATYMDDSIREHLHCMLAPCTPEEFLAAYLIEDPELEDILEREFEFRKEA